MKQVRYTVCTCKPLEQMGRTDQNSLLLFSSISQIISLFTDFPVTFRSAPWLRQLNIGLLIRRPMFYPRPFRGSFMVGKVALCRFSLPHLLHSIVSATPNMSSHRHYINFVIDSVCNRTLVVVQMKSKKYFQIILYFHVPASTTGAINPLQEKLPPSNNLDRVLKESGFVRLAWLMIPSGYRHSHKALVLQGRNRVEETLFILIKNTYNLTLLYLQ